MSDGQVTPFFFLLASHSKLLYTIQKRKKKMEAMRWRSDLPLGGGQTCNCCFLVAQSHKIISKRHLPKSKERRRLFQQVGVGGNRESIKIEEEEEKYIYTSSEK